MSQIGRKWPPSVVNTRRFSSSLSRAFPLASRRRASSKRTTSSSSRYLSPRSLRRCAVKTVPAERKKKKANTKQREVGERTRACIQRKPHTVTVEEGEELRHHRAAEDEMGRLGSFRSFPSTRPGLPTNLAQDLFASLLHDGFGANEIANFVADHQRDPAMVLENTERTRREKTTNRAHPPSTTQSQHTRAQHTTTLRTREAKRGEKRT
jgi:hypothetical protein